MRNPSFITSSLPRQSKHKLKAGPTAAVIGEDNYIHIGETILNHIPVVVFESLVLLTWFGALQNNFPFCYITITCDPQ